MTQNNDTASPESRADLTFDGRDGEERAATPWRSGLFCRRNPDVTATLEVETGDEDTPSDTGDGDAVEGDVASQDLTVGRALVIQPAAISRALRAAGYDGDLEALSASEEQRVRLLLTYRDRMSLWRRHVIATEETLRGLDALGAAQPNFAVATDLIRDAAQLSLVTQRPIRVPHLLLVSKTPGTGKTRYARSLADVLGTTMEVINGATIPDAGSIVGWPPVWKASGPGHVAKSLIGSWTSGPVILVDEVDKIKDSSDANPENKLLALLERRTARCFEDEFLKIPMRGENIIWIFTANDVANLSAPFLDRVVVVRIPDLSRDARDGVLERILGEVADELEIEIMLESRAALKPMQALGLRRARLAFEIAAARVFAQGRRVIGLGDLANAAKQLRKHTVARGQTKKRPRLRAPIGFIDPRRQRGPVCERKVEGEQEM